MDTIHYHIFVKLLVNHTKIFPLIKNISFNFCSSQNSYFVYNFFPRYKKLNFFSFSNIIEDHSQKWKTKQKKFYQANRRNYKKDWDHTVEIFLKIKKLKYEIMLTMEMKIGQMKIENEKQSIWKIITIK